MAKILGVYDSGLGGVSLLKELLKTPFVDEIYYYSDFEKLPYGDLSPAELQQRGTAICEHLALQQVDAILLACNTATVNTINFLRQQFEIPFVGIEPYVNAVKKEQVLQNKNNIGLIMTPATAKSSRVEWLKKQYDQNDRITFVASANLARHIESYLRGDKSLLGVIEQEVGQLQALGFDALILGCTHYPLIQSTFEKILNIPVIDPSSYVVSHLKRVLGEEFRPAGRPKVYYAENFQAPWKEYNLEEFRNA